MIERTTVGELIKFQLERVSAERSPWLAQAVDLCAKILDESGCASFLTDYLLPVGRLLESTDIHVRVSESELRHTCSEVMKSVSVVNIEAGGCEEAGAIMHSVASSSSPTIFAQKTWYDRATDSFDDKAEAEEKNLHLVLGVCKLLHEVFHLLTPAFLLFEAEAHRLQELGEERPPLL